MLTKLEIEAKANTLSDLIDEFWILQKRLNEYKISVYWDYDKDYINYFRMLNEKHPSTPNYQQLELF